MSKRPFKFKSKMDAYNAIRIAAGHGDTADKNRLIASAHKQYPPHK